MLRAYCWPSVSFSLAAPVSAPAAPGKRELGGLFSSIPERKNVIWLRHKPTMVKRRDTVRRFDAITVDDLNIRGMVKNHRLARAISDVAWGRFFIITEVKAENAGRTFERVDPRNTSQIFSNCGHRQRMPLAVRVCECGKYGYVIDRDHNSSITIDRAGRARINTRGERR